MICDVAYDVSVLVAPTVEPVTLSELKLHCRVDHSDEDAYLTALIVAARRHVEEYTQRTLLQTTLQLSSDTWPVVFDGYYPEILLPRPPLISVSAISYTTDSGGLVVSLAADQYTVDTYSIPGRITPAYNVVWPSARIKPQSVIITYVAGYGSAATSVPEELRLATKMLAGEWYRNREPNVIGTITAQLPFSVESLLSPYRVYE